MVQPENLNVHFEGGNSEEIRIAVFTSALMHDLDGVDLVLRLALYLLSRLLRRIGLENSTLSHPGILAIYGRCGMTARSREHPTGRKQPRSDEFHLRRACRVP